MLSKGAPRNQHIAVTNGNAASKNLLILRTSG